MKKYFKIAKVSEIKEGKMKEYQLSGKQITLAKIREKYFAFDNTCTHAQCSLTGGFLSETTITCYCHGAIFDLNTGKVLAPPATVPIQVYNIKIEGENIFIEI